MAHCDPMDRQTNSKWLNATSNYKRHTYSLMWSSIVLSPFSITGISVLKNLDVFFYEIMLLITYLQPDECYANRSRSPRHEENIIFDGCSAGLINGRVISVLVPWVGQISRIELFAHWLVDPQVSRSFVSPLESASA